MKRTKFILLALVVALILMGAGYAAWTQAFTINSTVKAGELFVKVTNTSNDVSVYDTTADVYVPATDENSPFLNTGDDLVSTTTGTNAAGTETTLATLSYNLSKIYPGTKLSSSIKFENKGIVKVKTSYDPDNSSVTGFNNEIWKDIIINVNDTPVVHGANAEEMEKNIADAISDAIGEIDAGSDDTITITQELDIDSGNETEQTELGWTVQLQFEQYNN